MGIHKGLNGKNFKRRMNESRKRNAKEASDNFKKYGPSGYEVKR